MEDYPHTLLEFEKRFATDDACITYLQQLRWPDGFRCPFCSHSNTWTIKPGLWQCTNCKKRTSITAGTIFQDTKYPLTIWFRAIWFITSQKFGTNALGLQRALGLGSYHTAWTWLHKLRIAMVRPGRDRLSGTVEVDEIFIGGEHSGKRGRGAEGKTLVLIAVEDTSSGIIKGIGRIRAQIIVDASAPSLTEAIQLMVETGSCIRTDGWSGYAPIATKGYIHTVVRKDAIIGKNTLPVVNRVVAFIKRWMLGTYQGSIFSSHLNYYLDEYTFRFNRRKSKSRGKLFYRLVQQAVSIGPVENKMLRGGVLMKTKEP